MAMSGSRIAQPVRATRRTAATTPAEVQTSVMRWCASASSAMEWYRRPAARSTRATARFTRDAATETPRPSPTLSSCCGCRRRRAAVQPMASAAAKMKTPSAPLEKYSAFP
jgi:hypothetical protein